MIDRNLGKIEGLVVVYVIVCMYHTYNYIHFNLNDLVVNMAITKEQIIEAAEQLMIEGVNPSMKAVRDRLKGGSFATISPVLKEWKENRESSAVMVLEMPLNVRSIVEKFGGELWQSVSSIASEEITKLKEEMRLSIESANHDRDESLSEIERLEGVIEYNQLACAKIESEKAETLKALEAEKLNTGALGQRVSDLLETISDLKSDLKTVRADVKEHLSMIASLNKDKANLSSMNGSLGSENDGLRIAKAELEKREKGALVEKRELERKYNSMESELVRYKTKIDEVCNERDGYKFELSEKSEKINDLKVKLESSVKEKAVMIDQVKQMESVIKSLTDKVKKKII